MREPLEVAERKVQEIGRMLKPMLPKGWEFVLGLASRGENGYTTYISTMERKSAVEYLRELADNIEKDGFEFKV